MRLILRLSPSLIQDDTNYPLEYELKGNTVGECLQKIKDSIPELKSKLWLGDNLNPQVLLFHNNTLIKESHFSNKVNDTDVLDVIPAIEGG
jgi:molybdopterin converting factor small subunit